MKRNKTTRINCDAIVFLHCVCCASSTTLLLFICLYVVEDKIIIIATTDSTFEFNILGSRHRVNYHQLVTQSFHLDIFYTNFLEKKKKNDIHKLTIFFRDNDYLLVK